MLLLFRARVAAAAPGASARAPGPEPVSGPLHPSWQPSGAARARALWAHGGGGGVCGGGFASAAAARPPPRPPRALARDGGATTAYDQQQQQLQQQQQYALGQVMTAQANFVRVRLHRALPPGAELPPLGDRAGDEALLRLWWGGGGGGDDGTSSSFSQPHQQQGPLLLCTVRGILKKLGQPVLVGDRVVVATTAAAAAAAGLGGGGGGGSATQTTTTTTTTDRGVVARVLPASRTPLRDPPVANADHVVLLLSLAQPPFEPLAASRFLVSVAAAGLPVTVALNKCDLVGPEEAERRAEQVRSWGYTQPGQVVCVSCETGQGLSALARRLGGGRTSVVAGPSGAGKSSMINALLARGSGGAGCGESASMFEAANEGHYGFEDQDEDEEDDDGPLFGGAEDGDDDDPDDLFGRGRCSKEDGQDGDDDDLFGLSKTGSSGGDGDVIASGPAATPAPLAVGAVSARSGRGRHTTRTVTLVPIPAAVVGADDDDDDADNDDADSRAGGLLADTPGFSMPSLDGVPSAGLGALFPDFTAAQEAAAAAAAAAAAQASSSSSSSSSSTPPSSTGCRFADCLHVAEPGCAVLAAVEAALDAADAAGGVGPPASPANGTAYVDPERLEHYYRFLSEAKVREAEDVRAMQEAKRRREGATKAVVGRGGAVRHEARLDGRKHRAVSRRSGKQEAMRAMMSDEEDDGLDDEDDGNDEGRAEKGGGGGRPPRRGGGGGGGGGRGRRGGKTR